MRAVSGCLSFSPEDGEFSSIEEETFTFDIGSCLDTAYERESVLVSRSRSITLALWGCRLKDLRCGTIDRCAGCDTCDVLTKYAVCVRGLLGIAEESTIIFLETDIF